MCPTARRTGDAEVAREEGVWDRGWFGTSRRAGRVRDYSGDAYPLVYGVYMGGNATLVGCRLPKSEEDGDGLILTTRGKGVVAWNIGVKGLALELHGCTGLQKFRKESCRVQRV